MMAYPLSLPALISGPALHGRLRADIGDAAEQVVERRAGAPIGHLRDRAAELLRQQHARQMAERADAGMRNLGVLSGRVHPLHQLADSAGRQVGARRDRRGRHVDQAHAGEIALGIERQVGIERHPGRQRHLMQQHRVAVRRRTGRAARRDHAAGPADVLDYDLLPERRRHGVLHDAGDRVGRAARRKRHDHGDRAVGIILRRGGAGDEKTRGETRRERAGEHHQFLPGPSVILTEPDRGSAPEDSRAECHVIPDGPQACSPA